MTDLILGPLVGGLTQDSAFLWGRANQAGVLYAWLGRQDDLSDAWLAGKSLLLEGYNGFAGVAPVSRLEPETRYHYALTLGELPPQPAPQPYPAFTTFPAQGVPRSFCFGFGSCFLPRDEAGGQIFRALEARRRLDDLRFLLLLGDQIYADAYQRNGIGKIACTLDEYRAVYAYTWSRPAFRELLPNLPAFMILDDHEVDDDWRWLDRQRQWAYIPWWDQWLRWFAGRPPQERHLPTRRVQDALQAYWEHQAMHAPAMVDAPRLERSGQYALNAGSPGSLAYAFHYGAVAFFVLDTRTHRVRNRRESILLGARQWRALEEWLLATRELPLKFLVTSGALLFNFWADIPRDRWSGFPQDRNRLLNFLAANEIRGLYLLTGDLHSAHAVRAELYGPQGEGLPLWEFCASAFEQDASRLSTLTYTPLRGVPLRNQQLLFAVPQHNFGVVRVDLADPEKPGVRFEVYGGTGDLLAEASA